jgi:quercetin dioxygenase-like cupin family protein
MTMSKMKWKLMLFGVVVACAFGGMTLRFAWATPGQDIAFVPIVGPVVMDEIDTKSDLGDHKVKIKTTGLSDVYVTSITIKPGGFSGWHSHPGPSFIAVQSGALTLYDDCDDFQTPHLFPAGTGMVEDAECVHMVVNEGDTDLVFVVVQIVPLGAPRRIDEPDPTEEADDVHDHDHDHD